MKTEILYGIHPVIEALRAGRRNFVEIYLTKNTPSKRLKNAAALADSLNIPVKTIRPSQLESMTGTPMHQGIGAMVSPYPAAGLADIIDTFKYGDADPFLLLLDNIVDPYNLGALVRTGVSAGVDGIIVTKDRSSSPTPTVSRASAGALEHVFLARVSNMVNTIKALKEKGVWIVGLERSADQSIFSSDFKCPVAIVIGGEQKGIRPLVKKNCDLLFSIPQTGKIDSLNASVAGAVVMYEVFRQREYNKKNVHNTVNSKGFL